MIILENRERRMVTYEIPVNVGGGQAVHVARVSRASDPTSRSASKDIAAIQQRVPTTLTLTAANTRGSRSEPVPDAFADIPKIKAALRQRRLVKHTVDSAALRAEKE